MTRFAEVGTVLTAYFDGLYHSDATVLARVFHPLAIYASADETPLLYRDMGAYFPVVQARRSPASRGESRRDRVDEIQFAGDNTAFARVRCSMGARDFVDFLTLVRSDGEWRIMSKVFQIIATNR